MTNLECCICLNITTDNNKNNCNTCINSVCNDCISKLDYDLDIDEYETIYSYKVSAVNLGGESFPSEILSTGFSDNDTKPILVINGFDRVSAPEIIDDGNFAGIGKSFF